MAGWKVIVTSGNIARVWHDPIDTHPPLCITYPELFSIANYQDDTIAQFRNRVGGELFRRRLNADMIHQFEWVKKIIDSLDASAGQDEIVWAAGPKGKYTTKSMYSYLEKDLAGCDYRWIWKAKLPVKIQIFLWQLFQYAILTRDVTKRRNRAGNPRCSFCDCRETYLHLFLLCPVARIAWSVRIKR